MGTLIICEKNDAAKQIARILSGGTAKRRVGAGSPVYEMVWKGDDTSVMGLRGHILELDFEEGHKRWSMKADKLHELIDAGIQKQVTEQKIVTSLRSRTRTADRIIVATDYDREGELIGVEALESLGDLKNGKEILRARYSSFTKAEIERAFTNMTDVDYKLAQAGEARQVIDLAWGAALTRFVSVAGGRRGRGFLSVGRVQTPTLAIIVDREKEIDAFVADPYWDVTAVLEGTEDGAKIAFEATHERNGYKSTDGKFAGYDGHFASHDEAAAAVVAIEAAGRATVTKVDHKEVTRKAPIPFSTTGYQQAASSLGYGVKRAMDIAQKLYLGGFISYHRTENTVYPKTLEIPELLDILAGKGPCKADAAWVKANQRPEPTRGKKETTDHPPIYPTAVPGAGDKLSDPEMRIWELVARRFLATLSPDARVHAVTALFDAGGQGLRASGQTTIDAGWRRVYPYSKSKETPLPPMEAGQELPVGDVRLEDKETQPPKRWGQGGLVAEMERLGIGTKATRHETIQKLIDRNYITENPVQPTLIGFAVTDALEEHAKRITDAGMTAQLEAEMDRIADGSLTLEATVDESRQLLHGVVDVLTEHAEPIKATIRKALDEDADCGECPLCQQRLLVRANRFGGRFIGCKGYPDCTQTYNLPARGHLTFRDEPCEECNAPYVEVNDRGRRTEQCVNNDCPTRQEALRAEEQDLGECPTCGGGTLKATRSRNWKRFVVCSNEECDQTYPLPQRGAIEPENRACEHCGAPRVKVITKGRKPWEICINMECPGNAKAEKGKGKASAEEPEAAEGEAEATAQTPAPKGAK